MIKLRPRFLSLCCAWGLMASAQYAWQESPEQKPIRLTEGIGYKVEAQAGASNGVTPLWLNANRYGLSSLDEVNGYLRCGLVRPLQTDSARRWAGGYGVDVAGRGESRRKGVGSGAIAVLRGLIGVLCV